MSRFAQVMQLRSGANAVIEFAVRGGIALEAITVCPGELISLPQCNKEGSMFMGWYIDAGLTKPVNIDKMPYKKMILYAKWTEDATVQEMYDRGLASDEEIIRGRNHCEREQRRIDKLISEVNEFGTVRQSVGRVTKITFDIGATARNSKTHRIQFESCGGDPVSAIVARANVNITLPKAVKSGSRFLGWFFDKRYCDMAMVSKMPSKNLKLYAKWDR